MPDLYPKQMAAIFDPRRYALIEASTKSGKTAGSVAWLVHQALDGEQRGHNFSWTSPVSKQSDDAFRRTYNAIPPKLRAVNLTEKRLTLFNGAMMWFQGGDEPDYLYGKDVFAAVIDEASRVKEAAWHAVRSTLTATRGPIRIIGNVKGRKNWFFRLARIAEKGEDPAMGYHKLIAKDAIDAGVLSADEVEDARLHLPEAVFRELYLAEPSDDQGNPFGLAAIRECTRPEIANTSPAVWGWDIAKRENWTVGIALDRQGNVCRFVRLKGVTWETITNRIMAETRDTAALVDATGVGDPILERLQASNRKFEGYNFSMPSKQRLMEGLAVAIQRKEISFPEGVIADELEVFEYVYNEKTRNVRYSAPEGFDDDCVMALALAVMHRSHGSSYVSDMSWVGGPKSDEAWPDGVVPPPTFDPTITPAAMMQRRGRVWYPGVGWR